MVPSSFMISQTTPDGSSPASRAMSTAASVWPARTSTPPSRAISGKMCPGVARSARVDLGSIATWTVRARSAAEMPVVMPSRASMLTVNAVERRDSLPCAISGRPSASTRRRDSARQIRPRPCLAMKLIASALQCSAGMTRSPSFSRLSSSTRMNIRPALASSTISSIELRNSENDIARPPGSGLRRPEGELAGDIAGEHVDLDVHGVARPDARADWCGARSGG